MDGWTALCCCVADSGVARSCRVSHSHSQPHTHTLTHSHTHTLPQLENGKTVADAKGDVFRGLEVVEYACHVAADMMGETAGNLTAGK